MIKRVADSYKNNIIHITLGPLLKVIEAIFDLLIPLFMKAVIDLSQYADVELISNKLTYGLAKFIRLFPQINENLTLSDALIGGIIIFVMGILGFAITMVAQFIAAHTAVKVSTEVRDSLFNKILHLSKKQKQKYGTNRLMTTLNSDTYQVQQGVLIFIRLTVRAPVIVIGALIISFILDWRIGLAFTAIVPMILAVIFIVLFKAEKNYVGIQKKLDDISLISSDTIDGARVIRAFEKEDSENTRFVEHSSAYQKASIAVNKINSLINPLTFAITSIVLIIVLFIIQPALIGGSDVEKTVIATTMIAEMAYLAQIFFTTVQLTNVLIDITKTGVSRRRIDEILTLEDEIVSGDNSLKELGDEIVRFEHVYFSYSNKSDNYTLKDISFTLNKGQTIGIIGGTGSGKSTIISLLERFYDVSKGSIYFQGQNIKDIDLKEFRNRISLVNQKASLFKGDIRSNFLMAKDNITDLEIYDALKMAEAYDFVMEKGGLTAEVEESGINFSGGQRQRLAIARSLVKPAELFIFDDSMSALDLLTDKKIRENIKSINASKIIISQRVATIKDADLIIVLEHGEISSIGTHNELVNIPGIYKEIYETQIRKGSYDK